MKANNMAAMREALEKIVELTTSCEGVTSIELQVQAEALTALSEPPRNCDLPLIAEGDFGSDADKAWRAFRKTHPDVYFDVPGLMRCIGWLLEAATDKKGGEGGE